MSISLIVAASTNNVIGRDGDLPWRLPEDLRRFKRLTIGKPIIMGRATHESIGRALPERQNIVLTSRTDYQARNCDVAASPAAALDLAGDAEEIMVIGGGQIYRAFLPHAQRIYMTRVHETIDGDTFFPELDQAAWQLRESQDLPASEDHPLRSTFEVLERRR